MHADLVHAHTTDRGLGALGVGGPVLRLVLCAPGTHLDTGRRAISALMEAVSTRFEVPVLSAYLDVQPPRVGSVLSAGDVVVPLQLAYCHQERTDIRHVLRGFPGVRVAAPLGPSTILASILHQRLTVAGLQPGDAVVLAASSSQQPQAAAALHEVADDLACLVRRPVHRASVPAPPDGTLPLAEDVVRKLRAQHRRVLAAPYLLEPDSSLEALKGCGADAVARPILHPSRVDPLLVELVCTRAVRAISLAGPHAPELGRTMRVLRAG